MEANIELVEKLVEKTGVSYTEAKRVLEKTDWDILEAIIALEAEGKISQGRTAEYSTKKEGSCAYDCNDSHEKKDKKEKSKTGENFKESGKSLWETVKGIFDKGNTNYIEAYKNGNRILGMPVTVFVLLLVLGFWVLIPLMIVGLFFGFRYSFSGNDLGKESVNNAMGKATDIADNIKDGIKSEFKNDKNEDN